ncbi:MAG: asparagine synthetase B, partial [Gammaproteobacteria bacterium]|nr:asparagine synthetase B [Gammaproteobacteria bacterium]
MCGIHGVLALEPGGAIDPAWAARMGAVTRHRGPDDEGLYTEQGLILGMRRLSIIDLSPGGAQPMVSAAERFVIVYNGEVFN